MFLLVCVDQQQLFVLRFRGKKATVKLVKLVFYFLPEFSSSTRGVHLILALMRLHITRGKKLVEIAVILGGSGTKFSLNMFTLSKVDCSNMRSRNTLAK